MELSPAARGASRSCFACNRKKVRCDKKTPCTSCARSGKSCNYPPAGPRTRRSKKTLIGEMASRINNLESALAMAQAMRTNNAKESHSEDANESPRAALPSALAQSPDGPHDLNETPREAVLVHNGSSNQYYNDILLSRALAEVSENDVSLIPR